MNVQGWRVKVMKNGGRILLVNMQRGTTILTFKDSMSIINAPLREFGRLFNLPIHKEVMCYKIYTEENRAKKFLPKEQVFQAYREEQLKRGAKTEEEIQNDIKQYEENANTAGAMSGDEMNILLYAEFYCIKDCEVMREGLRAFETNLQEVLHQDDIKLPPMSSFVSISSIGAAYCHAYGCFDDCYEVSGKPQNFMMRCLQGGRCMTANNQKQMVEDSIEDFDAVSLYPSAMSIMWGIPKGIPVVIGADDRLEDFDDYYIEINIKSAKSKCPRPYRFPLLSTKSDKNKGKVWSNDVTGSFYVDKRSLLDLLEYYDIDYEFVRGYGFYEGFNTKINEFIQKVFNLRLKYKREGNKLHETIKLLMNSIYGKSIIKPIKEELKIMEEGDEFKKFCAHHYNFIKDMISSNRSNKIFIRVVKPIVKHFNSPQFGVAVLSWSKHIMNRVMCLADQNGIDIYYQDTDSMHLLTKDVPRLGELFKQKYGTELIGENLCQFHCDFKIEGIEGPSHNVHSTKLIAVGKKSYWDHLVDDEGHEGQHIRMKGIPDQCIKNKARRINKTVEYIYQRLYDGEEAIFDLTDGAPSFQMTRTFDQKTRSTFNRRIRF
jgi:hypothetical protein